VAKLVDASELGSDGDVPGVRPLSVRSRSPAPRVRTIPVYRNFAAQGIAILLAMAEPNGQLAFLRIGRIILGAKQTEPILFLWAKEDIHH
jgi:hypothetical protein